MFLALGADKYSILAGATFCAKSSRSKRSKISAEEISANVVAD